MNDSKISVRYSKALFGSSVEKNILDKVNQDMLGNTARVIKTASIN